MQKITTYNYPKSFRRNDNTDNLGYRTYDVDGVDDAVRLPSVTTILSGTKDKSFLNKWIQRVGEEEANRIRDEAAKRGTAMHHIIEGWVQGQQHLDLTPIGQNAHTMARQVIEKGLEHAVDAYYGIEAMMYYPNLYAGSADLIARHKGEMAIIDFKQTNKPKQEAWIEDYFLQLAAYGMAHDQVYGTNINKGVIMMCSVDNYYQEFIISGKQFRDYKYKFLKRLDQYYKENQSGKT